MTEQSGKGLTKGGAAADCDGHGDPIKGERRRGVNLKGDYSEEGEETVDLLDYSKGDPEARQL